MTQESESFSPSSLAKQHRETLRQLVAQAMADVEAGRYIEVDDIDAFFDDIDREQRARAT